MATVTPTVARVNDDVAVITWTLTSTNRDGAPISQQFAEYSDRTIQVTAATWGGATVVIQGSNDATTWFTLNDPTGTDATGTGNFMFALLEAPLYVRPYLSVAGTSADPVAVLVARRSTR